MKKYGKNSNFSAFYEPGQNWYVAMTFVARLRRPDRRTSKNGKWKGTLDSPQAIKALTAFKSMVDRSSRGRARRHDEAHPYPSIPFAKGRAAVVHRQRLGVAVRVRPQGRRADLSPSRRRWAPTRCRATSRAGSCRPSSAAPTSRIRSQSHNKALAADWIKAYTSTASMTTLIAKAGNIPNTTTLAERQRADPALAPFAKAATLQLVRADRAELGQRREREHAQATCCTAILTNRQVSVAAGDAPIASKQITQDPERQVVTTPGKRDASAMSSRFPAAAAAAGLPSGSAAPPRSGARLWSRVVPYGLLLPAPSVIAARPRPTRSTTSARLSLPALRAASS